MKKIIVPILLLIALFNCGNTSQEDFKSIPLSKSSECSKSIEFCDQFTKNQLETILNSIKPHADTPVRFTYVNNIDNHNVLTDFSTLSDSTEYHYFIKKKMV